MDAANALGALSTDLAFSVSYAIANEAMASSREYGISPDELIAVLLVLAVVLASLPRALETLSRAIVRIAPAGSFPWMERTTDQSAEGGLTAFVKLIVSIGKRISVSIAVQLLANHTRANQPLRSVRILSLLSIAIFFLFLQKGSLISEKRDS